MGSLVCLIGLVASGYLLQRAIRRFRREWREAEVSRAPALPEQAVRFSVAGDLRLYLEAPRFYTWGKRLSYSLHEESSGRPVAIAPSLSGSGVRMRTRSRVERGRFVLPAPGSYVLRVAGLEPAEATEYAVVFMRPYFGKLLGFILSCVFLGMILVGCLVGAILFAVL